MVIWVVFPVFWLWERQVGLIHDRFFGYNRRGTERNLNGCNMSNAFSFEHAIALPSVHRVQEALLAFFRGSEAGAWTVDRTPRDDGANLHLIRGNWAAGDSPGVGGEYRAPGFPRWVPQQGYLPNTIPMLLSITLDESLEGLLIRLKHTAFSREAGTELREIGGRAVDAELKSLAKYLKQSFHLPSAPEVVVDASDCPSCVV